MGVLEDSRRPRWGQKGRPDIPDKMEVRRRAYLATRGRSEEQPWHRQTLSPAEPIQARTPSLDRPTEWPTEGPTAESAERPAARPPEKSSREALSFEHLFGLYVRFGD